MDEKKGTEWPNLEADPAKKAAQAAADKADTSSGHTDPAEKKTDELTSEFRELGNRLVSTAKTAWQSEQRQEVQQEITDGLRTLRDQLNEAFDSARSTVKNQNVTGSVKEQVHKVSESAKSGDFLDEIRTGLATGLRELNGQLQRLSDYLEKQSGSKEQATAESTMHDVGTAVKAEVHEHTATASKPEAATSSITGTAPESTTAHSGATMPDTYQGTEPKSALPKQPEGPAAGASKPDEA